MEVSVRGWAIGWTPLYHPIMSPDRTPIGEHPVSLMRVERIAPDTSIRIIGPMGPEADFLLVEHGGRIYLAPALDIAGLPPIHMTMAAEAERQHRRKSNWDKRSDNQDGGS